MINCLALIFFYLVVRMGIVNYDVIVATYNGSKYIEEQLMSILNQTILPHKIFIRDDGATDDTLMLEKNCCFV